MPQISNKTRPPGFPREGDGCKDTREIDDLVSIPLLLSSLQIFVKAKSRDGRWSALRYALRLGENPVKIMPKYQNPTNRRMSFYLAHCESFNQLPS